MIVLIHIYSKLCRHFSGRLKLTPNDRGYGHWRFAGAFAVVKRQGELKISEANAGAKPPECIACPDNNLDQPANEQGVCYVVFFI